MDAGIIKLPNCIFFSEDEYSQEHLHMPEAPMGNFLPFTLY